MAKQSINLGTGVNTGDGDALRSGGDKINDNFNEIYTEFGDGSALQSVAGDIVGTSDTQTLTNKTIDGTSNTIDISASQVGSGTFANARISEASVTQHQGALSITESQISDLGNYIESASPTITTPTLTLKQAVNPTPTAEGDIQWDTDDDTIKVGDGVGTKTFSSDADINIATSQVTSGTFADARISSSSVTQHQAALSITESQISDLGAYITGITGESINDLSDVVITSVASGELLRYDGASWVNNTLAEAGVAAASHTHVEADITDLGNYIESVLDDTTPQLGGMLDVNGQALGDGTRELLTFTEDPSGVNYVNIENEATGSGPIVSSASVTDTNVDLNIQAQGTGNVYLGNFGFNVDQTVGVGEDNYVLTYDNATGLINLEAAPGAGGGINNVVEDSTPQLGGDLDANAFDIQFDNATGIRDDSDNEQLIFNSTASAVTYVTIGNNTTGNAPTISAAGETNVSLNLVPSGTGDVQVSGNRILTVADEGTGNGLDADTVDGIEASAFLQDITGEAIASLSDVVVTSVADNEVLAYNTGTSQWINQTAAEAGLASASHTHVEADITDLGAYIENITGEVIGDLSNVVITTPADNEVLAYNNGTSQWINQTAAEAGLAAASHTHVEADITDLGAYIENVLEDTTPQLGGNLDTNANNIDFDDNTGIRDDSGNEQLIFQKTASAINHVEMTNAVASSGPTIAAAGGDTNVDLVLSGKGTGVVKGHREFITVALSDLTTDLTTGTSKAYWRAPYALTILEVRASVLTAPTGSGVTVDINESGTTILSTKLSIDATEKTSETAATAAVISDTAIADDAEITFDIDAVGSTTAGKGLQVTIIFEAS